MYHVYHCTWHKIPCFIIFCAMYKDNCALAFVPSLRHYFTAFLWCSTKTSVLLSLYIDSVLYQAFDISHGLIQPLGYFPFRCMAFPPCSSYFLPYYLLIFCGVLACHLLPCFSFSWPAIYLIILSQPLAVP